MTELVMLAKDFKNKDFGADTLISRKFDGKRVVALVKNNEVNMYSRAMNKQYLNPVYHILKQLEEAINYGDVYDGELVYIDNGTEDFKKGISLAQSQERKDGCDNLKYIIFTNILRRAFDNKINDPECFKDVYNTMLEYFEVKEDINNTKGYYQTKYPNILIACQYPYEQLSKLTELAGKLNWEGLMLRNGKASNYEFRRSPNLLKVKKFKDAEFKIEKFNIGTGKYSDTLGSITVRIDENNLVDVGSGFTDIQRNQLWSQKDTLNFNEIQAKVKYFEESTDRKGNKSLRFPTFISLRNINTLEEM